MRKNSAVTLIELIIAISLLGILFLTIGITTSTLYNMKKDVLSNQQALVQGTQASLLIFERLLRAEGNQTNTTQPAFVISDNGRKVCYNLPGAARECIWQQDNNLKYNDGVHGDRVILTGVNSVNFLNDYQKRLAVNIDMSNGQTIRTCVQPRNEFTPQGNIN